MGLSLTRVTRNDLARRVAVIHAQLWVADETADGTRAALADASDALGVLVRDMDDDGDVAAELASVRAFAAGHLAATIDLREATVINHGLRRGRTHVEERLSDVLLAVLEVPSASSRRDVVMA